ncbi:MAG: hypothetical protein PHX27_00580 [Candidatus ainarchaeum sp.]|nr:hypothetical protein [Candidatus ainarchaeum sp.]
MIRLILKKSVEEYLSNIKVMFSYGILFIFIILFLFFNQFFFSSGTVHLIYNESILTVFGLLLGLIFLYFFSFFVSLTVYSIKRDVQKVNFDIYWNVLLKNVSIKIFVFYFFLSIFTYAVLLIGVYFNFVFFAALFALIVSSLLMYVPQSIILDEVELVDSIKESLIFWKNNFVTSVSIIVLGSIILFFITILEFGLELILLPGTIVSFALVLIFLIPFIEQVKSYAFILRFNLIKQSEVLSAQLKPKKIVKIDATRLREKSKYGKI